MLAITKDLVDIIAKVEYANKASPEPTASTTLFANESTEKYASFVSESLFKQKIPLSPSFKIKFL